MPTYKVLQKSFIGNRIVEEGELIEYSGKAGKNLQLVEAPSKKSAVASKAKKVVEEELADDSSEPDFAE
jgi:hypothetical protein